MDTKILQWNLNGFYTRKEQLELLINKIQPAIICLQETHFKDTHVAHIKHYTSHFKNRVTSDRASGGVATFINHVYAYNIIPLITEFEAAAVRVLLETEVTICNIYIPNAHNFDIQDLVDLTNQLPKPYILVGDFNSHSTLWGSNKNDPRGSIIESLIDHQNLCILNTTAPTHINMANGALSAIDLCICTSNITHTWELNVLDDPHDSDHFPLIVTHPNPQTTYTSTPQPRWKMKLANWGKFGQLISKNIPSLRNPSSCDKKQVNTLVEEFTALILDTANQSIPKTNPSINHPARQTPWWNPDCARDSKKAKHAFNIFKKYPTLQNKINYLRLRSLARRTIKTSKKESWKNFVNSMNNQTPSKIVWDKLNQIRGTKKFNRIPNLKTAENEFATDPFAIANTLGHTFATNSDDSNFGKNFLTHKINSRPLPENSIFTKTHQPFNSIFKIHELKYVLNKCKNSSPGPDNIPNIFLKNLPEIGLEYLLSLYNYIWDNMVFPTKWREATIIPIHKTGKDVQYPANYRPIALTNNLCKILEKMVNRRLIWYLETNSLFFKHQSGFRHSRSTTDHLINFHTAICEAFINNFHLAAVSMDIEKAFEMVWKDRVVKILHNKGITGNMLALIHNFLLNRVFRVRANGSLSDSFSIPNGVPQGSVLSVTLFLLAINDAPSSLSHPVECLLFADDLIIFCTGTHFSSTEQLLQNSLNELQKWSNQSGLKFSTSKTVSILFSKQTKIPRKLNVFLNGSKIETVTSIKLLGLHFDNKLSWKTHIQTLKDICTKRLSIMKSLSSTTWGADHTILIKTYRALIKSKLDYGAIVYNSAKPSILRKLDPIHHTALRLATGAFRTSPINSILLESGEIELKHHRNLLILKYAISISATPHNPTYTNTFSIKYEHKYNSRPHLPQPLYHKLNILCKEINISLPKTYRKLIQPIPPWENYSITINIDLLQNSKKEYCPILLKTLVNDTCNKYPSSSHIYTDGSKSKDGSGYAIVTANITLSGRLNHISSVTVTELVAIRKALEIISTTETTNFIILSDSKNAILSLTDFSSTDELIQTIQSIYISQINTGKTITLLWIPSHIGIPGNEKADSLAKSATKLPTTDPSDNCVALHDLKKYITTIFKDFQVNKIIANRHSKYQLPPEYKGQPQFRTNATRREQTVITRLRIGHSNLTHLYLIDKQPLPICPTCNAPLTIQHILIDCEKFTQVRIKLNIPNELNTAINSSSTHTTVLQFLKEINMYDKI